ncbi:hypothetical protein V8E36_006785 [Tilletia maclaganii]
MRTRTLLSLFITFFVVANVEAYDSDKDEQCNISARKHCPQVTDSRNVDPWEIWYYSCMAAWWKTIARDDKCPHPDVDCRCYRGCVSDRSNTQIADVGGYCVEGCKKAKKSPLPCNWN